jgi:hypothetical protein
MNLKLQTVLFNLYKNTEPENVIAMYKKTIDIIIQKTAV